MSKDQFCVTEHLTAVFNQFYALVLHRNMKLITTVLQPAHYHGFATAILLWCYTDTLARGYYCHIPIALHWQVTMVLPLPYCYSATLTNSHTLPYCYTDKINMVLPLPYRHCATMTNFHTIPYCYGATMTNSHTLPYCYGATLTKVWLCDHCCTMLLTPTRYHATLTPMALR